MNKTMLLEALFDNSKFIMWIKNEKGEYIEVNETFLNVLGKKRDEVIGKSDFDMFDKAEAEIYANQDKQVLNTGELMYEAREVTTSLAPHAVCKLPIYNKKGDIIATAGFSKMLS